jgi:hypothetical protein
VPTQSGRRCHLRGSGSRNAGSVRC